MASFDTPVIRQLARTELPPADEAMTWIRFTLVRVFMRHMMPSRFSIAKPCVGPTGFLDKTGERKANSTSTGVQVLATSRTDSRKKYLARFGFLLNTLGVLKRADHLSRAAALSA
jgi:hypothetical protein